MDEHPARREYLAAFPSGEVQKEALKQALDIRKFEIDLYWRRATYFWAFIAAAFAAYFALQKGADSANLYVVTCLGLLFSLAWYFVNRGSGAWQRNWEAHVDLLEDEIMGPLYKTLINRRTYRFIDLLEPFSFSPSRINNLLSLLVTATWCVLLLRTLSRIGWQAIHSGTVVSMTILTVVAVGALGWRGASRRTDDPISVHQRTRSYR